MSSMTNTTAPGDTWHSPRASLCSASTRDHRAVTFRAAFCTTTPASRAPLSNEKPSLSLLGDVTSLVEDGSSGDGLPPLAELMSSSPSTLFRGLRWRTRLMKRLTRRVVLWRAVAAALAAVVVVGCIYCRLTTDAVFGARFCRTRLQLFFARLPRRLQRVACCLYLFAFSVQLSDAA